MAVAYARTRSELKRRAVNRLQAKPVNSGFNKRGLGVFDASGLISGLAGTICRSESLKSFLTGLTASSDNSVCAAVRGFGLPAGRLTNGLLPRRNQFVGAAIAFTHAAARGVGAPALTGSVSGSAPWNKLSGSEFDAPIGVAFCSFFTAGPSDFRFGASDTGRPTGANFGKSPCSTIL